LRCAIYIRTRTSAPWHQRSARDKTGGVGLDKFPRSARWRARRLDGQLRGPTGEAGDGIRRIGDAGVGDRDGYIWSRSPQILSGGPRSRGTCHICGMLESSGFRAGGRGWDRAAVFLLRMVGHRHLRARGVTRAPTPPLRLGLRIARNHVSAGAATTQCTSRKYGTVGPSSELKKTPYGRGAPAKEGRGANQSPGVAGRAGHRGKEPISARGHNHVQLRMASRMHTTKYPARRSRFIWSNSTTGGRPIEIGGRPRNTTAGRVLITEYRCRRTPLGAWGRATATVAGRSGRRSACLLPRRCRSRLAKNASSGRGPVCGPYLYYA